MTEEVRQALRICPPGLRQAIDRLPDAGAMEELRLRCGQPPACRIAGKEHALPLAPVTPELLRGILAWLQGYCPGGRFRRQAPPALCVRYFRYRHP